MPCEVEEADPVTLLTNELLYEATVSKTNIQDTSAKKSPSASDRYLVFLLRASFLQCKSRFLCAHYYHGKSLLCLIIIL